MKRSTRQRAAIEKVLQEADRPLSPNEVLSRARKPVPSIGQATVYRTLNALQDEGSIVPVVIPGQPARYEKADLTHHHHFSCRHCGRVYELAGCPYEPDGNVPEGFSVESHDIILYGRCAKCR